MTYTEFTADNYSGLAGMFQYAKDVVLFYDSILFGVILLVLTFSIYFIQEGKKGKGDFVVSFCVGCISTLVLAIIIGMVSGFTSGATLGILIGLTIVSFILLFFSEP